MPGKDLAPNGVSHDGRYEMTDQPSPREAELTKLADGSLPPDREAELRAGDWTLPAA